MNKFYVSKGALYVLFAILTPLLLDRHPIMMGVQMTLLSGLGVTYMVKGARSEKQQGEKQP